LADLFQLQVACYLDLQPCSVGLAFGDTFTGRVCTEAGNCGGAFVETERTNYIRHEERLYLPLVYL
jgi:hypothetical protein